MLQAYGVQSITQRCNDSQFSEKNVGKKRSRVSKTRSRATGQLSSLISGLHHHSCAVLVALRMKPWRIFLFANEFVRLVVLNIISITMRQSICRNDAISKIASTAGTVGTYACGVHGNKDRLIASGVDCSMKHEIQFVRMDKSNYNGFESHHL